MKKIIVIAFCIVALVFTPALACKGEEGSGSESTGEASSQSSDTDRGQNSSETSGASADAAGVGVDGESDRNGPNEFPCDILIDGPDCDFRK